MGWQDPHLKKYVLKNITLSIFENMRSQVEVVMSSLFLGGVKCAHTYTHTQNN